MKTVTYLLVLLAILSCRRDNDIRPREADILVGKWDRIAYETPMRRGEVWVETPGDGIPDLIVRSDGVLLDSQGRGLCVQPDQLLVNGKVWKVKSQSPVPINEGCYLAYTTLCESMEFQVTDDNLLSLGCSGKYATRYRRLL